MNKEKYELSEIEVIGFRTADVLVISNPEDEYEAERTMIRLPMI